MSMARRWPAKVCIAGAAESIRESASSLHALIDNAASLGDFGEKTSSADPSKAAVTLNATLLGAWRVTQTMLPLLRAARSARLVFVTSGAGSHSDLQFGLTTSNAMGPAYSVAKAAMNALSSLFAKELEGEPILVNAICPGLTATFPGAESMGARPVADGARGIVWVATLPDGGPTGCFFRDGKELPW